MELVIDSLLGVLTFRVLLLILTGTLIGILVGALPGINAPTGIALAIPLTFTFSAAEGLILLGTIYCASIYGGSISAILMNVPGEPADVVTCFDGYPMAKRGEPQRALNLAAIACAFGSFTGFLALLFLSPPLSRVALLFGPTEIFWVAIFGMTVIGAISRGSIFNGLLGGAFGMLMATMGLNPVTGVSRFTFGIPHLVSGIDIVSALIGLFALSEMMSSFQEAMNPARTETILLTPRRGASWSHMKEFLHYPFASILSSAIGIIIGIIPAAGPSIGALMSYGEVRRHSANRSEFGRGAPEGLIAASVGKNAVVGGSIVPLLTLGVPGSPAAAILLGGLIIHGLFPGPELFTTHAVTTYTFIIAMVLSSFAILAVGVAGSRIWGQVTKLPVQFITPTVIALCVIGSYATRGNPADVLVMTAVGLAMFLASKAGFEPAPVVIGLVLGDLAENGFLLGRMLGEAEGSVLTYFFLRPIPVIMIALTLASLAFSAVTQIRGKKRSHREAKAPGATKKAPGEEPVGFRKYHLNIAVGGLAILFGFWAERQLAGLEPESVVFPHVILWVMRGVGAAMIVQELVWGRRYNREPAFGSFQIALVPLAAATVGFIFAVLLVDYYLATSIYLLVVALILEKDRVPRLLTRILPVSLGMPFLLYLVFYRLLDVRMHSILF
jgi:putative tricarboxylic transport membrane protein